MQTEAEFWLKMKERKSYITMTHLKDGHSYKIWARNAYVGIWIKNDSGFMVSRYKVGDNPYLFTEYHWDTGEPFGTVKPLELIEKCSFELKDDYLESEEREMLEYLDKLEENHPIINGVNTLQDRKDSAISFEQSLSGKSNRKDI